MPNYTTDIRPVERMAVNKIYNIRCD